MPPTLVKKTATKSAPKKMTKEKEPVSKVVKAAISSVSKASAKSGNTSMFESSIRVHCDAGWGNNLYLRGVGGGLSWEKGTLMQNNGSSEWIFKTQSPTQGIIFKILLNDEIWCQGEDLRVPAGACVDISPIF